MIFKAEDFKVALHGKFFGTWDQAYQDAADVANKRIADIAAKESESAFLPVVRAMADELEIRNLKNILEAIVEAWKKHQGTKFSQDGSHFQADLYMNELIEDAKGLIK